MNRALNPFSPNAGSRPPELAGRSEILDDVRVMLARLPLRRSVQSILLTGIRGVGKTVILNEINRIAEEGGQVIPILLEADEERGLGSVLSNPLRESLLKLDRAALVKDKARIGLAALRNFMGTLKITFGDVGVELSPQIGLSDSGDFQFDLTGLLMSVAEAAASCGKAVLLLIDEVQYLSKSELGALVMAIHKMTQNALPLALVGAGLPTLPALTGNAKSYSERLFEFIEVGALTKEEAIKAIRVPLSEASVRINDDAADFVYLRSGGYPYFIQEWGFALWNYVEEEPISLDDAHCVDASVTEHLDRSFFRVRVERMTHAEREFLTVMSRMSGEAFRISDIAKELGVPQRTLSPRRSSLMQKGMIYSPRTGEVGFTVPLFAEYLQRRNET